MCVANSDYDCPVVEMEISYIKNLSGYDYAAVLGEGTTNPEQDTIIVYYNK